MNYAAGAINYIWKVDYHIILAIIQPAQAPDTEV